MSDFTAGQVVANIRRDAEVAASDNVAWAWKGRAEDLEAQLLRARQNELHWQGLAQQLQQKLAATELQSVKRWAHGDAAVGVIRELREHLAEIAPADPLAKRDVVRSKLFDRRRQLAADKGLRVVDDEAYEVERVY